jgi:hypothetical protein
LSATNCRLAKTFCRFLATGKQLCGLGFVVRELVVYGCLQHGWRSAQLLTDAQSSKAGMLQQHNIDNSMFGYLMQQASNKLVL